MKRGKLNTRYFNREMETISLRKLKEVQSDRLRALVERCYRKIPYYQKIFDQHGLKPKHIQSAADLVHLPTFEKKDLRALYPFGLLGTPLEKIHRFAASSGTTGVPTVVGFSERDWKVTQRDILGRIYSCFGMNRETFLYQTHGYGLFLGGPLFELAMDTIGATLYPAGPGRTLAAIQWLKDMKHNAISGTPTFIQLLINKAKENGIDPKKDWSLKVGAFGGETAAPGLRKRIAEEMPEGFTYNEQYGSSEIGGFSAHSCPHTRYEGELHVMADHYILEVLSPETGKRVEPGAEGDLVFTSLTREAMPIIRWNTHDIVKVPSEPYGCPCGRKAHPKISRVIGRSDDVLKVRGTLVFPSQIEDILSSLKGTTEGWHIVLEESKENLSKLRLEVEVDRDTWGNRAEMSKLESRIEEELIARFGTTGEILLMEPGALPRYEGKAKRVIERKKDTGS